MRVLVNAVPLMAPPTGVGRYVRELLGAAAELDPALEVTFARLLSTTSRAPRPEGVGAGAVGALGLVDFLRDALEAAPGGARYAAAAAAALLDLGAKGRRDGFDLYHETHFVPRRFDGPTVMTIYDLSLALHPATQPELRVALFRREFARRLPSVARFITLTESVRDELAGEFGVDPARVRVTLPGVDHERFHPSPASLPAGLQGEGYFLFVGTAEPRKNLGVLLEAYAALPDREREEQRLVLAGPAGWKSAPLRRRALELGLGDRLSVPGFVPEPLLPAFYRGATALVYPSIYEGFGLPVVEAMASGCPVLCSDIPALREVAGEAALRLPPGDTEAWRAALVRVNREAGLRSALREAGLRRAAPFTWRRCAAETLEVYRELAA